MQIVKSTDIVKVSPIPSTDIWEYPTDDETVSGVVAQINGRYPKTGFAMNEKSKELVFVISGNGIFLTPAKNYDIDLGDEILIQPNEKFAWDGIMTLFMATTPKFNSKQHKIII